MAGRKGGDSDMVLGGRHLIGIFFLLVVVLGVVFSLGYLMGRSQYDVQLNPSVEAAIRKVDEFAGRTEKPEKSVPASKRPAAVGSGGTAVDRPTDWDFYHSNEEPKTPEHLEQPPKLVASKAKPAAASSELKPSEPKASAATPARTPTISVPAQSEEKPAKAVARPAKAAPAPIPAKNGGSFRPGVPLNTPPIPAGATVLQVAALVREADALALAQALQQKKFPAFVLTPGDDNFYRVQVGPYGDAQAANTARHALETQGFKSIIKR
jgi:cell division septation protein DedD